MRRERRVPMSGLHLYCVSGMSDDRAPLVAGTSLITFRDLGAVVRAGEYRSPGHGSIDEYLRVIDTIFHQQAVLPAPPGVVFRSRDLVAQWLELHYFTLVDALAFVEDRAVARVHVKRLERKEEMAAHAGSTDAAAVAIADSLRVLRRHAVASVAVMDAQGAERPDEASYLVERERWGSFSEIVEAEDQRHDDLTITHTGPWAPYDFVRMQFGS